MNAKTYRPRKPTATQKEAAHSFYDNKETGDAPQSDLPWTNEQQAEFRREAGLPASDAEYYAARPSRNDAARGERIKAIHARIVEEQPHEHGLKSIEPALSLRHTQAFNGQLHGRDAVLHFIRAGNATVTVVSRVTGKRFTFKFQRPKDWTPGPQRPIAPTFCKVLTGADNENDFEFVGTMWPEDGHWPDGAQVYRHGKAARIGLSAESVRALVWFLRTALHPDREHDLSMCEVWHEGRCGRCGRKLTVPSSVASGFGPECEGRM